MTQAEQDALKKTILDAASDAEHLIKESKVIQHMLLADVACRRVFLLVRQGMEAELTHRWEVENMRLVMRALSQSAENKSVATKFTARELREDLFNVVLPLVDAFCQMEMEIEAENERQSETDQTVPGRDPGTAEQLGDVLHGTRGNEGEQAGVGGEGNSGEAGSP